MSKDREVEDGPEESALHWESEDGGSACRGAGPGASHRMSSIRDPGALTHLTEGQHRHAGGVTEQEWQVLGPNPAFSTVCRPTTQPSS